MQFLKNIFQAFCPIQGIEQKALAKVIGLNMSVYKPADQSVTSSVALVNDDSLFAELPIGASRFVFDIPTSMAGAGGLKLQLIAANGLTVSNIKATALYFVDGDAPGVKAISALSSAVTGGTTNAWTRVQIVGSALVTNPGVLQLQFAQDTSSATATKTLQGATLNTVQITA